ncbi:BREX-1 system phosphatase PglZ type B [Sphaerotilus microaerophilus]|uniref:BREX-1 system phosphatase PglZ type B n=1 Tax=Sphaerotilus microaerophilus TaxID=2914710 RepID=A0ABN6PT62_9BURK|nr:BREX-1 system phosphatase PglZ type B [Sphaerotilus sp. FB-5]BDI07219.1 hypothetical protein CATMQ487_41890 [Sphaerotilus sp. FB-5]
MNLKSKLAEALQSAAKVNRSLMTAPAAVLWADPDRQWQKVIPSLAECVPGLLTLGDYEPGANRGPSIWLKAVVGGAIPLLKPGALPVIYLPGISKADLRAIESCPRDLQPLAELQYRGTFWGQVNGKDWTVNAFLTSKGGGLGLDVAQDKVTQEALAQVLDAGVLMETTVADLQGRSINAEWLLSLLAPNPTRDLLLWMNEPSVVQHQWGDVLWSVFIKRCRSDFGFDPVADGVLVAAERLAKGEGKWAAVAVLYRDSFASFPNVYPLLAKVQPPQLGLFPDQDQLAGYPQANEQGEGALRYALSACASMDAAQARSAVVSAEKEHGLRRGWLWSRMGRSPLATALEHLADVAQRSAALPIGRTPAELAASYQETGWQVDQAALKALSCAHAKSDAEPVGAALRAMYLPWLEESARRLQDAVKGTGGLTVLPTQDTEHLPEGVCTVFVDGLRYDVAKLLEQRLSSQGKTRLEAQWTSMPSVTASGKAWCSPVANLVAGTADDVDFEPRVAADGKPLSGHNLRRLLAEQGVAPLEKHETGDSQGRAWTEAGDLDHYGHEHGLRLARDMTTQLDQVVERIAELADAGWKRIRIVTDHGWLLVPGGLPKSELAKHQAETRWGRCAVLKDSAHGTPLTFGWDWCKAVQVAYAPGVTNFIAGADYAHGGISLQECLVPVLQLECAGAAAPGTAVTIQSVSWKGLRCTVVVAGASPGQRVDIRTKAALASSSLAASKPIDGGKASLAVADDEQMGTAAVVVVLGADGEVLQKRSTTVGEK